VSVGSGRAQSALFLPPLVAGEPWEFALRGCHDVYAAERGDRRGGSLAARRAAPPSPAAAAGLRRSRRA